MDFIDEIYYTLLDEMSEEAALNWVGSIWEPGGVCAEAWQDMLAARERLCARLGAEEDGDVERIIDSLSTIQRQAARRMFLCGMRYREQN